MKLQNDDHDVDDGYDFYDDDNDDDDYYDDGDDDDDDDDIPPVPLLSCFALPWLLVGRPHRDDVPEHEHDDPDDVLDHHVDVDDVLDHYNHVDDE